jgi:CBS domain containing-hemolysin-like protein
MSSSVQIIICLILSAFFSGMEIAFLSANRLRIELDKKQGLFSARIISIFLKKPTEYIAAIVIANNVVLVIYGLIMANILESPLHKIIANGFYVLILQTLISTLLILVSAEFLPKVIFRLQPNFFLKLFSLPVFIFLIILYPITKTIIGISHFFLRKVIGSKQEKERDKYIFGKIDLNHLFKESGHDGKKNLDTEHEIRIFRKALDFASVKLRDCMVPRTEVVAIEDTSSIEELRQKFIETGFSKILVYNQNIDNIIGYVSNKELFNNPQSLKSRIISASIVPETMNANKLLHRLLQDHKSLAVVVDEFGGTSGIVTIEDIMEEIFGEIEDEHDSNEIIDKKLSDNSYTFSGKLPINVINENHSLNLPESEEYDTVAGYILHELGRVPEINEEFEINNFQIKILKTANKRLEIIYLKIVEN